MDNNKNVNVEEKEEKEKKEEKVVPEIEVIPVTSLQWNRTCPF